MKAPWTATSKPLPRKAYIGAGFVAASLLGSLGGQPASAFQATFNMQVADEAGTSRTFTFGGNSDLYTEMTVGSRTQATGGSSVEVTTDNSSGVGPSSNGYGLCVISSSCSGSPKAATFSFSKPVELGLYDNFRVGRNSGSWTFTGAGNTASYGLALFYNGFQQGDTISLDTLTTTGSTFRFNTSVLAAANSAITVGLVCTGADCGSLYTTQQFYISDVIVEAPAPLPLIGTGAAFAWTRRLRRRIKATPSPTSKA